LFGAQPDPAETCQFPEVGVACPQLEDVVEFLSSSGAPQRVTAACSPAFPPPCFPGASCVAPIRTSIRFVPEERGGVQYFLHSVPLVKTAGAVDRVLRRSVGGGGSDGPCPSPSPTARPGMRAPLGTVLTEVVPLLRAEGCGPSLLVSGAGGDGGIESGARPAIPIR
jgi:hypothetical protein